MVAGKNRPEDIREASVREALAIIESEGVEKLSLRQIARRLGVSHQAPYKHFPSRDHLLAEVVARTFSAFAQYLDARPRGEDPWRDLGELGQRYLDYAHSHPLQYRLMFGTPLPDPDAHPAMLREARHALSRLEECIAALPGGGDEQPASSQHDALFAWALVHGLSSLLRTPASAALGLGHDALAQAPAQSLRRVGLALAGVRGVAR